MVDEGEKAIIDFMNGVANALRENQSELNAAGKNLSNAIMQGAIEGAISAAEGVIQAILSPFKAAIQRVKDAVKSKSPSKVFEQIGKDLMLGATLGVTRNSDGVVNSLVGVASSLVGVGSLMAYNIGQGIESDVTAEAAAKKKVSKIVKAYRDALAVQRRTTSTAAELGKYLGNDFADGLGTSQDNIDKAFEGLNDKLQSSMDQARQTIQQQQAKLRDLFKAKKLDYEAIARAQAVINANEALLLSAGNAKQKLKGISESSSAAILRDWTAVDVATQKLKDLESQLASAISAKESAIKSYTDQFSAVPDIDETSKNPLPKFLKELRTRKEAVEKYRQTLEKLKGMGLDDATYAKLLSEGTGGQVFADQLIAGGPSVVAEINSLDTSIGTSAEQLATSAASKLHDAGIESIKGLIEGAKSEKAAAEKTYGDTVAGVVAKVTDELKIKDGSSDKFKDAGVAAIKGFRQGLNDKNERGKVIRAISKLVDDLIDEVKKKLKIQSPSKVFEKIGTFTTLGMAGGISDGAKTVTAAVGNMGDDAVGAMKSSMTHISNTLADQIDANPVITPVLDLSDVEAKAQKLNNIYASSTVAAEASYSQAVGIVAAQKAAQSTETVPVDQPVREIKFEQNNYSPEALSETEIYRQTNNQLAQARRALGLST